MTGSNYPPGVGGNEWQITGECPGCSAGPDDTCKCSGPHAYHFDPEWDGLCKVCGGESGDPLHVDWIMAQEPPAGWPPERDYHKAMLRELET